MCSADKLGYSQFLPLIPYYIPVFHITYSCVMITQYVVTIITLNKHASTISINFKKNKYFIFPSIMLSSVVFLSSCRSRFLSKSFSFHIKKIFKMYKLSASNESFHFPLSENLYFLLLLKDNITQYRINGWCFFSFHNLTILLHSFHVCTEV